MKTLSQYIVLFCLAVLCIGCASKEGNADLLGAPRLVAQGLVTDELGQPLQGIRVDIYGVRKENEPDVLSYNYNFTDSTGHYTIVRYTGREKLEEVTMAATDPQNIYAEQTIVVPVVYEIPNLDFSRADVTANFVLQQQ